MPAAGPAIRTVGEFHYVHHRPDGRPYEEPNELAFALIDAARAVGIRIVLDMAAYARGGAGSGPSPGQRRFCDRSVEAYLGRVESLAAAVAGDPLVSVGYAPHSLRAVPRDWLVTIAGHAARTGYPLHIHAGEQPREVAESLEEFGRRPIEHLGGGVLGPTATVVHATHVSGAELDLLAQTGSTVCACPTTEANLGDGFLPAAELWELGVPVSFGADSNVRLDPFEEARETEGCARRLSGRRNVLVAGTDEGPAPSLWRCLTSHGARSLGLPVPGIVPGLRPIWSRSTSGTPTSAPWSLSMWPQPSSSAAPRRSYAKRGSPVWRRQLRERERGGFAIGRTALSCVRRCGSAMVRSALVAAPAASQPAATLARTYAPGASGWPQVPPKLVRPMTIVAPELLVTSGPPESP